MNDLTLVILAAITGSAIGASLAKWINRKPGALKRPDRPKPPSPRSRPPGRGTLKYPQPSKDQSRKFRVLDDPPERKDSTS